MAQAKTQVNHLRTILETGKDADPTQNYSIAHLPSPKSSDFPDHNLPNLPAPQATQIRMPEEVPHYEQRQQKRRKVTNNFDLHKVESNMERHGHGIFKPPYPYELTSSSVASSTDLPPLLSKDVSDALIRQYRIAFHSTLPIIHWPSFQEQYDILYRENSFRLIPRVWIALLYAVYACGSLQRSWNEGRQYLHISKSLIDLWTEDLILDHVRTALLSSVFLVEMNLKSAGWVWIGFAIRISFDIGLHCEAGTWSAIEEEMRRRVWWSTYTCDW